MKELKEAQRLIREARDRHDCPNTPTNDEAFCTCFHFDNVLDDIDELYELFVCPRCIEDYEDADTGEQRKGTREVSDCVECEVCKDCEHMAECPRLDTIVCPECQSMVSDHFQSCRNPNCDYTV